MTVHGYYLSPEGEAFVNTADPVERGRGFDAAAAAMELDSPVSANLVVLGFAAGSGKLFCGPENIESALNKGPVDIMLHDKMQKVLGGVNEVEGADMIVTPKEIDTVVEDLARIIADGLNMALHEHITLEEAHRYMH
jgi:hypothetical protein